MSGTITTDYLVVKNSIYYTEIAMDIECTWPDGSTNDDNTTGA